MDLITLLTDHINIFFILFLGYIIAVFCIKERNFFSRKEWNYVLKRTWAEHVLKKWRKWHQASEHPKSTVNENLRSLKFEDSCDTFTLWGINAEGASLFIRFSRKTHNVADISLNLILEDGTPYRMPNMPRCTLESETAQVWSGGDLKLILLDDFKQWRIIFNGLLFVNGLSDQNSVRHFRMNFIWIAGSEPISVLDETSVKLMASSLAVKPWRNMNWMHPITHSQIAGYDQYGCLMGTITMDEGNEPFSLHFPGIRQRRWGTSSMSRLKTSMTIIGIGEDGVVFQIQLDTLKMEKLQLKFGNVRKSNGSIASIDDVDVSIVNLDAVHRSDLPKAFAVTFSADSVQFKVFIHLHKADMFEVREGIPWNWENIIIPFHCIINGVAGYGFLENGKHYTGDCPFGDFSSPKHLKWFSSNDLSSELCVAFDDERAGDPKLVGEKGASLALLYSLQTEEYSVPEGFCLTVNALEMQINEYGELSEALREIVLVNLNYSETALQNACKSAEKQFSMTPVCRSVAENVKAYFNELLNSKNRENFSRQLYFAVRSSGIGEDSEESSAAGQNATILGCVTFEDVLMAIQKCWSSLFSFQSVTYRRQHGLQVKSGMGVVVQIVVEAAVAGVMFTRHPSTGNPSRIVISSNYGLGESIVSGQVEPDTITLYRSLQNTVALLEIKIGRKTHKLEIAKSVGLVDIEHTLESISLDYSAANALTLSEKRCLQLGKLAIMQETLWGSARDVEWAIVGDKIYLLQSRPVTSFTNWTEFELCHEFDSPIMTNNEILTFANTGEVLPGSMAPLSISTVGKYLDDDVSTASGTTPSPFYRKALGATHYHLGINVLYTLLRKVDNTITIDNKVMDVAVFGHVVTDSNMHSIALHRNGAYSFLKKMVLMSELAMNWWKSKSAAGVGINLANNFCINAREDNTCMEIYKKIDDAFPFFMQSLTDHSCTTSASVFSQVVLIKILIHGQSDFTTENYTDIAAILSSCKNVISADIPKSLKQISDRILASPMAQQFCDQNPKDAYEWLESNCPDVYQMMKKFLQNHGHRSIKEFDFITDTWGLDPTGLLESLQATVGAVLHSPNNKRVSKPPPRSTEQLIAELKSQIGRIPKMILQYVIPMCQNSVANREMTKAALITILHKIRLVYRILAKKMVAEWKIPDEKTIYFMTHGELGKYLETRNPSYLMKALQRRRFFARWDALHFSELNWGVPKPLSEDHELTSKTSISQNKLIGTSVYSGCVVGRACVVPTISDIGQLKCGDILITHSTDVGWSPYFPILGGVITELGGLISHGAVVAREYGLPCIVGTQRATSVFKTGDIICLNATEGFVGQFNDVHASE